MEPFKNPLFTREKWEPALESSNLFLIILFLFLTSLFVVSVRMFSPLYGLIAVVAIGLFIISFINLEAGFIILIFSMLFSPELTLKSALPGAYRGLTLRYEDFLLLVLFLSFLSRTAIRKELGGFSSSPLQLPILIFVVMCVVSTTRGAIMGRVNLRTGFLYIFKLVEYFLIYFMVFNSIRNLRQAKFYLVIFLIMTALVGTYGFLQIGRMERVAPPFDPGQPNTLGGFFILMYACILAFLSSDAPLRAKLWIGIMGGLIFIPFLYTLSRSSYLALLIVILAYSIIEKKWWLLGLSFLLLFLSPWILPHFIKERIAYTFSGYGRYSLGPSAVSRIGMWKYALRQWWMHPFLGNGVTGIGKMVDSQYIRTLGELGIIGFAVFIWLLATIFKSAWALYKDSSSRFFHAFGLGYLAGFSGILVHALTTITFYIVRIMEPFWFLTGILMALWKMNIEEKEGGKELNEE